MVDEGYFFRLLHNLVGNAKSVGADKVEITVWRAGQLAIIDIADNGPGMDAKARADMFKPGINTGQQRARSFDRA